MAHSTEFEPIVQQLTDRTSRMTGQLGNWIMLGNAGGLAFVLTAARDLQLGKALPLEWAYGLFLLGLALGFVGHGAIATALTRMMASAQEAHYALAEMKDARERLEALKEGEDSEVLLEEMRTAKKRLDAVGLPSSEMHITGPGAIGILAYSAATLCLIAGLILPLTIGVL